MVPANLFARCVVGVGAVSCLHEARGMSISVCEIALLRCVSASSGAVVEWAGVPLFRNVIVFACAAIAANSLDVVLAGVLC